MISVCVVCAPWICVMRPNIMMLVFLSDCLTRAVISAMYLWQSLNSFLLLTSTMYAWCFQNYLSHSISTGYQWRKKNRMTSKSLNQAVQISWLILNLLTLFLFMVLYLRALSILLTKKHQRLPVDLWHQWASEPRTWYPGPDICSFHTVAK